MKTKKPRTSGSSAARILPPLYKDTAVLSFDQHSGKALKPFNGFDFSAATPVVPLMLGEFAHAARFYPILFTAGDRPTPVALLGLKERQNLFVEPDGRWRTGVYVPAYLRRYPFILRQVPESGEKLLAIDTACDRYVDASSNPNAAPLFSSDGSAAPATRQAMSFCHAFHEDHVRSIAFGNAVADQGLLITRQANLVLSDSSNQRLGGFCVIDSEKFNALRDSSLLCDWHEKGWLAAISTHLLSLLNWEALMRFNAGNEGTQKK